jgi:ribosomal protein L44E
MNKSFINTGYVTPSAYVTKNRQRVKQYNESVYLNNGDEFEIELFNPTQNKVLAKIELNGKSIGSGIIVRPGERVFLERYLDVARKFLFETYKVSGTSAEVARAIANNGLVNVKFFSEYVNPFAGMVVTTNWNNGYSQPTISQPFTYNCGTGGVGGMDVNQFFSGTGDFINPTMKTGTLNLNSNISTTSIGGSGESTFTSSSMNFSDSFSDNGMKSAPKRSFMGGTKKLMKTSLSNEVETGRIEQGSRSNQSFKLDSTSFNSYPSWESTWHIVPLSEKPVTREDLVLHCTHCGTKRKKDSHKFCPFCGNKF